MKKNTLFILKYKQKLVIYHYSMHKYLEKIHKQHSIINLLYPFLKDFLEEKKLKRFVKDRLDKFCLKKLFLRIFI